METKFEKVDGRWVVNTGNVVAVAYINMGDDYDVILADQYKDVCTGETFAKQYDVISDIVDEPIWKLVKHYDELPEYRRVRKNNKKAARQQRIRDICGINWSVKRIGKNRRMARIMWPNAATLAEYNETLPF